MNTDTILRILAFFKLGPKELDWIKDLKMTEEEFFEVLIGQSGGFPLVLKNLPATFELAQR